MSTKTHDEIVELRNEIFGAQTILIWAYVKNKLQKLYAS